MVNLTCPGCDYQTGEFNQAIAIAYFNAHLAVAHAAPAPAPRPVQPRQTPRVDRPPLTDNITEETGNAFDQSWAVYLRANDVPDNEEAVQLYSCCDMALKTKLTSTNPNIINEPVDVVLILLKTLTVIPVAKTVKRNELLKMQQDAGENIRTFLSRVKGKAITCSLQKECAHPHAHNGQAQAPARVLVDFTDEWIRHVLLNGIYDEEVRREVFEHHNLDTLEVNYLVTLIEGKETGRDATRDASKNALSEHRWRNPEHHDDTQRDNRWNGDDSRRNDTCNEHAAHAERPSNYTKRWRTENTTKLHLQTASLAGGKIYLQKQVLFHLM